MTITNNDQAIPPDITSEIVKDVEEAHTIEASWQLRNRNSVLQLLNLKVDDKPSPHDVELAFRLGGSLRVNIGKRQYNKRRTEANNADAGGRTQPESATSPDSTQGFDELDKELFSTPRGRRTVAEVYRRDPESQKSMAEKLIADGKLEAANRILSLVVPPKPEAVAASDLAQLLEKQGQLDEAADAYLKAYRLSPALLAKEHVPTIVTSGRTRQLVDVLTPDRLRQLNFINDAAAVVNLLLSDEVTRAEGYRLLRQEWSASDRNHHDWLSESLNARYKNMWSGVPDPDFYIRSKLVPSDFAAEGDGWNRFRVESWGVPLSEEPVWGMPFGLKPLLQHKDVLKQVAEDVEAAVAQHPYWKAGPALLCFLEAELGNSDRSAELLRQLLNDAEKEAIPRESAWVFGLALQGRNEELDQLVIRLYEHSLEQWPTEDLRDSPLNNLAALYRKVGRNEESRKLLQRLETDDEATIDAGAAATNQSDSGFKEAILRERSEIRESIKITRSRELVKEYGDLTPETVIAALDDGLFAYPLDKNHPETKQPSSWGGPIRLRTSVRDEGGHDELFSPVIDLLSLIATPNGSVTEESILKLDRKLVELSDQRGLGIGRIEAGVAATVFAFQRGDLKSATKRLKDLRFYGNYYHGKGRTPFDLNLWLAVRNALNLEPMDVQEVSYRQEPEETIAVAKKLAEYAIRAARNSSDPQVEQALLRERDELLQRDRLELAKVAFARGDREVAREILRTVPGVGSAGPFILHGLPKFDSDAAVAFKLAELLEEESDWSSAADAYLEAYRGEIRLLSTGQVHTFKKCGRTTEFVQTLIEEHVVTVDAGYLPISIVELLLEDEHTRADGDQLLKHLWASPRSILIGRLLAQKEIWKQVPDLSYYLRERVLPKNFESAGAGWTVFEVRAFAEYSEEPVSGFPLRLDPLLQDKAALRKLSKEVAVVIERHPDWKAGPAVSAFLEAEIGNYQRATELIRRVLADAETRPIPSDSALLLGLALEGRDDELDRQVIRLYEGSLRNRPLERTYRVSAIPRLARLHAKFDQLPEARRFLHRMTTVDYDPRRGSPICVYGRSVNRSRCNDCHSGKSNLLDVCLMSDTLTDLGYPVDSLISLARIDASFGNAYGSDDAWTKKTIPADFYSGIKEGRSKFVPLKNEAMVATTPQAVLEALKSGVFSGRDMTKPAPANAEVAIDLMTSVRGVDGKSVLFSPALEVLELAAKAKGDEAAIANVQIDQLLSEAIDKNPDDLEAGISAAVFAFLRNDLNSANGRLQRLQAITDYPDPGGAAFWLVARHALRYEQTRIIGAVLANRAIVAAEAQPDSGLKEAIVSERAAMTKLAANSARGATYGGEDAQGDR